MMHAIYDMIFIHVSIDILMLLYWFCIEKRNGLTFFHYHNIMRNALSCCNCIIFQWRQLWWPQI